MQCRIIKEMNFYRKAELTTIGWYVGCRKNASWFWPLILPLGIFCIPFGIFCLPFHMVWPFGVPMRERFLKEEQE